MLTYLKCSLPLKLVEAYANVFKPIKSRVLSIHSTNYNYINHMTLPSRSFFLIEVALLSSNSLSNSLGCLLSHGQGVSYSSARHNSNKLSAILFWPLLSKASKRHPTVASRPLISLHFSSTADALSLAR